MRVLLVSPFAIVPKDWIPYFPQEPLGKEIVEFRDKAFVEYFSRHEYLEMIEEKFGGRAVEHIEKMLKTSLKRN